MNSLQKLAIYTQTNGLHTINDRKHHAKRFGIPDELLMGQMGMGMGMRMGSSHMGMDYDMGGMNDDYDDDI